MCLQIDIYDVLLCTVIQNFFVGLVKTIEGLSLSENPIKYPASQIISKGVHEILQYLHHVLLSKSNGNFHAQTG